MQEALSQSNIKSKVDSHSMIQRKDRADLIDDWEVSLYEDINPCLSLNNHDLNHLDDDYIRTYK